MGLSARNKLAFPCGFAPGINPFHPLGQSPVRFSCISRPPSAVNLLSGKPGVRTGAPTAAMNSYLGPCTYYPSGAYTTIGEPSTAVDPSLTFAAIFMLASTGAQQGIFGSNLYRWYYVATDGTLSILVNASATVSTGITLSAGVPYFAATSVFGSKVRTAVVRLDTGQVMTSNAVTGAITALANPIAVGGLYTQPYPLLGYLAAAAWIAQGLTMRQLVQWAADPWSFWYLDDDQAYVGASAMPGKSRISVYW